MIQPIMQTGLINKFKQPAQFPVDEILSEDERIVRGWVSVEVKDKQGEVVPIDELRRTLNTWVERDAPISDNHSNRKVGKGLRWFEGTHPKSGKKAIAIDYKIHDHYSIDDQVWEEIKSGERKGLSFGGRATGKAETKEDDFSGEQARHLHGLETYEIASVHDPANQFAENTMVNYLAKSNSSKNEADNTGKDALAITVFGKLYDQLPDIQQKEIDSRVKEFIKLSEKAGEVNKPFAGYKDFDECVARNSDKDDPKAYCATIMREVEGKSDNLGAPEAPEKAIDLKGSAPKKETGNKMAGKKQEDEKPQEEEDKNEPATKQEGIAPPAPPAAPPEAPQADPVLQILQEIKQLLLQGAQPKVAAAKQDEDDEEPKKPEEEEPKDEEKQNDDEESKPDPEGGDVILPKAPAGETDEDDPPETDETRVMEKVNEAIDAKLKSLGVATTPRPKAEVIKRDKPKQDEFALKMLAKARKGEIDQATMNREIKKHIRGKYDSELKNFMETFKKEDV